jgi:nucleoside-diphosphate-sugar epimerase
MGKQVLVVGGTGYVGQELCIQLQQRGDDVATLNRSASSDETSCEWIQADIIDAASLDRALAGREFDVIYHVAALPGDTGDPVQMITVNVLGLTHVLDYARQHGGSRVVISSSISAYEWYPGTKFKAPDYQPVDEEHPCRPRDVYSTSKRMQELLGLTFFHQYKLPVVSLRLTAVIGPRGKGGGRGWREFAEKLVEGKSVQIPHFSPNEVCHYIDYRDVARLNIAAGDHPEAPGQIFNCCGPGPISGSEFADVIRRHFPGIEVETGFPWSMAQGEKIRFSMDKAKKILGIEPQYTVEDSIIAIKDWIGRGGLDEEAKTASDKSFGKGVQSG